MTEQVENRGAQEVVGRQEARAAGNDSMPVMVGVAGKSEVELVLESDQRLHGPDRGRIHPDLAVPVDGHEPESGVHALVDDGEVESVAFGDPRPVMDPGTPQRVDAEVKPGALDRLQVDHLFEIGDVGTDVVVPMGGRGGQSLF